MVAGPRGTRPPFREPEATQLPYTMEVRLTSTSRSSRPLSGAPSHIDKQHSAGLRNLDTVERILRVEMIDVVLIPDVEDSNAYRYPVRETVAGPDVARFIPGGLGLASSQRITFLFRDQIDRALHIEPPERLLVSEGVESVLVPGTEGDMTILANHAPLITTLKPGLLDIVFEGGREARYFVKCGFAEAYPKGLTVLAETAINRDDLDAAKLDEAIRNAEEDVNDADDPIKRDRLQIHLDYLRQVKVTLGL